MTMSPTNLQLTTTKNCFNSVVCNFKNEFKLIPIQPKKQILKFRKNKKINHKLTYKYNKMFKYLYLNKNKYCF